MKSYACSYCIRTSEVICIRNDNDRTASFHLFVIQKLMGRNSSGASPFMKQYGKWLVIPYCLLCIVTKILLASSQRPKARFHNQWSDIFGCRFWPITQGLNDFRFKDYATSFQIQVLLIEMAYRNGISYCHIEMAYRIGISNWHIVLSYRNGLSNWHIEMAYRIGISFCHIEMAYRIAFQMLNCMFEYHFACLDVKMSFNI